MRAWLIGALFVAGSAGALAFAFYSYYCKLSPYWQGVAVESFGVFIEVTLLLVAFGGYEQYRLRSAEIKRLHERIEDVKRIDDPHAHGIVASSIKALARYSVTDIDMRGARLTDFSFYNNDIKSLEGANFSDGLHLSHPSRNFTCLNNVDFQSVNCKKVQFGAGDLSLATYQNCTFWGADLRGASFEGITMNWDERKVISDESAWEEQIGTTEDGSSLVQTTYVPAFDGANLAGCSFRKSRLAYIDFRDAKNVDQADFTDATGLDTCFFD